MIVFKHVFVYRMDFSRAYLYLRAWRWYLNHWPLLQVHPLCASTQAAFLKRDRWTPVPPYLWTARTSPVGDVGLWTLVLEGVLHPHHGPAILRFPSPDQWLDWTLQRRSWEDSLDCLPINILHVTLFYLDHPCYTCLLEIGPCFACGDLNRDLLASGSSVLKPDSWTE